MVKAEAIFDPQSVIVDGKRRTVLSKNIEVQGANLLCAYYRDYHIEISLDKPKSPKPYYALVTSPSGDYIVEGWFGETQDDVLAACIKNILLVTPQPA